MSDTFAIAVNRMRFVEKPGRDMDWETFNAQFVNVPDMDIMRFINAIYNGHAYCPCMDGVRKADNFQMAQHIAVDIDSGDQRAALDTLARHPLVQAYAAILHETPSHTPLAPRARVIFILDEPITTAEGYKAAVATVAEMFDGADPACVDAARFFYGNGKLGAEGRTQGIRFWPDARLPLTELRRYARLRADKARAETPRRTNGTPPPAPSGNGEQMTLAELRDRLDHVNAYGMDYAAWLKLIAAIRHVYGDGAYDVVRAWSDAPGKDPLTMAKWDSLSTHPSPAGYGTIVQMLGGGI